LCHRHRIELQPQSVSPKNARGLMQFAAANRRAIGCAQCFDPRENIEGGTRYLKDMLAAV